MVFYWKNQADNKDLGKTEQPVYPRISSLTKEIGKKSHISTSPKPSPMGRGFMS
jgi:hypothetical protein